MKFLSLLVLILVCSFVNTKAQTVIYTLDADFDKGVAIGVNHNYLHDQLQLDTIAQTWPYVWFAASGHGTVVRINVNTGVVEGEYRTAPQGMATNPSRTTVDRDGNLWTGNRDESSNGLGSVVKVALIVGGTRVSKDSNGIITIDPNGQYLQGPFVINNARDRDGDGLIKTSRGLSDTLPWPLGSDRNGSPCTLADPNPFVEQAEDEAILLFQRVHGRAVRHLSVDNNNDIYVGGDDFAFERDFDLLDGQTGCIKKTFRPPCGGYGGFIDCHGVLWSADRQLFIFGGSTQTLRYDIAADTGECINIIETYGIGIDNNGFVWNSKFSHDSVAKISPNGTVVGIFPTGGGKFDRGVVITPIDNHVWIANSGGNSVSHLDNNGNILKIIPVGITPTGVAVDLNGKIWVSNLDADNVMRIDPNGGVDGLGAVDLTIYLSEGSAPYNYSDMTGHIALSFPPYGTWTILESDSNCHVWDNISWTSLEPTGTSIIVQARVANTETGLPNDTFKTITSGTQLAPFIGSYLEVKVNFNVQTGFGCDSLISPILYDLSISGNSFLPPTEDAGPDSATCVLNDTLIGGNPTATGNGPFTYQWLPKSGLNSSTIANPLASPGATTTYTVTVTDVNGCTAQDVIVVEQCCLNSSDYVLIGLDDVKIESNNTFISGAIGVQHNSGSAQLSSNNKINGTGTWLASNSIRLGSNNTIDSVFRNSLKQGQNNTINALLPYSSPLVELPCFPKFTFGKRAVVVGYKRTVTIKPGDYRSIRILSHATLRFEGGTYTIGSFTAGSNNMVIFDSTTTLLVKDRFSAGSFSYYGPDKNSNVQPSDITIYFEDRLISFNSFDTIAMNIYAPYGVFVVNSKNILTGSFIAKSIKVQSSNTFTLDACWKHLPGPCDSIFKRGSFFDIDISEDGSASFAYLDVYPNPFEHSTTITYSLHNSGIASIELFNISGIKLQTIFEGTIESGSVGQVTLTADQIPAGVYLLRLSHEEGSPLYKKVVIY